MTVCAASELNTGEQEWGAFSTASHGMHMTQNLIDRLSSYTSTVYDFHAGLIEVLKDSVSRALQRSSVFIQHSSLCVGGETSTSHFLLHVILAHLSTLRYDVPAPPFKILDPPLSIST